MTRPLNAQAVCANARCQRKASALPVTLCAACLRSLPLRNAARVDAVWAAVDWLHHVEDSDLPYCVVCGCTDERACRGGCHWAADPSRPGQDVCSRCVGR